MFSLHRLSLRCLALALCAAVAVPCLGQVRPGPKTRISRSSFSHLVPDTVGLFAELRLSKETHQSLRGSNFWALIQSLAGESSGQSARAFDWRGLLRSNLGMPPEAALAELFGRRVAVAAPSWERLGDAVILIRLRSPGSLDPVIAGKRLAHMEPRGDLHIYRTVTGLWIASNGRLAAFSQDGSDDALFWDVADRMNETQPAPLSEHPRFVEQVGRLSRAHMAYVYFADPAKSAGVVGQLFSGCRYGVIGMSVHRSSTHFELRARLEQPRPGKGPLPIDVARVQRLPDSALFVWAGSLDLPAAYRRVLIGDAPGEADYYLELLGAVFDLDALEERIMDKLGRRAIVVWDRARGGSSVPQLSLLLESSDAVEVARALAYELADAAYLWQDEDQYDPVKRIEHLDAEIFSVALDDLVSGRRPRTLAGQLLGSLQPSFAALDGWVVAATSPGAIRQIIDADRGWIPRLNSIRSLGLRAAPKFENRVVLAVAQPAIASAVLAAWQDEDDPNSPWRVDQMAGNLRLSVGAVYRPTLGVAIKEGQRAGSVRVVRVHDEMPAVGRLEVDDEIIGVDGRLLDLEDPVADLRRRVAQRGGPDHMSVRVRRRDRLLEVVVPLPRPRPEAAPAPPPTDPIKAIEQFQSAARLLNSASYTVYRSPANQFHARVSLQLVPAKQADAAAAGRSDQSRR